MKGTHIFQILCASVVTVLLSACGATLTKSDAIETALKEEAFLRELAATCQGVSPDARVAAYKAQQNWWKRNGTIVEASDSVMVNDVDFAFGERDKPAAKALIQVTGNVRDNAESSVKALMTSDNERTCLKELEKYQSGEKDLSNDKQMAQLFVDIQNKADADYTALKSVKKSVSKDRSYGRSLFVVENKLSQKGCQGPKVALLRSAWPLEVYDAQCPDKTYYLVRCQWGKCKVY